LKKIAVIGNYLPRQCGIATFTSDLCDALAAHMEKSHENLIAVAMDDIDEGYDYPNRVKFQIRANVQPDYIRAADFLNIQKFDIAILQHEFGIFGGSDGAHIIRLIKNLRMPVMTTLHTVLQDPSNDQRVIIQELARYSESLVIMAHKARLILKEVYGIDDSKIKFIPHGIPDTPFERSNRFQKQLGLSVNKILLTFGLLSPAKGLDVMIKAMPGIIERHPEAVYIILGESHPYVVKESGDSYLQSLYQLVNRLGMNNHVLFRNRFVNLDTLIRYITAADVYITPYVNEQQIVSGTLAYATGMGTPVVSTPFWYAKEMLADGRGRLVSFNDDLAMAEAVNHLLDHEEKRMEIRKKCYRFGRSMIWKEVGQSYLKLTGKVLTHTKDQVIPQFAERPDARIVSELPDINLKHMRIMTDTTGMLQHATYSIPDRSHGYCVDDNARALIVACMHYSLLKDKGVVPLIQTYLSFIKDSFNQKNKRFRNFMSYDRRWLEEMGSEDSHGRSLWGLGIVVKYASSDSIRKMAASLFSEGLPVLENFTSPRAWAFAIVGLQAYMEAYGGDTTARRLRTVLGEKLFDLFKKRASLDWPWCEDKVTYANAKLSHALILAGQWIPKPEMFEMGINSLKWLLARQKAPEGHLSIIGNTDWHNREGDSSTFDQQPIEAMCLIEACAEAFRATGERTWIEEGHRCLSWFLGRNDLNAQIYDFETGGCCDGMQPTGVNANQGAESTLSWLISLLTMYKTLEQEVLVKK
jgi:glycosyltransferase involved in cell wall biosynthesis